MVLIQAVAGMSPPGRQEREPQLNVAQVVVAAHGEDGEGGEDGGRIADTQNTPAQYHARPEMVEALTTELREQRR